MSQQNQKIVAALNVCRAVFDAIREAGSIPSGHLYAACMTGGMSLKDYEWIIDSGCDSGIIRKSGDVLHWVG